MGGRIANVQISHPGASHGGDDYWENGLGARLEAMYGELLGMDRLYIGYHKLVNPDGRLPAIGFEYSPEDPPPRWPDPAHPQQVHLDIEVEDLDAAENLVVDRGATRLHVDGAHRVFADPAGHPFCLYRGGPGRIVRVVFDCVSPRALAAFYEELLGMRTRLLDTPERVEISGEATEVVLAFQHSLSPPPRWPDPAYPAQLHLDLDFDDSSARDLAERLGAIYLPVPDRPGHLVYADPAGHPFCPAWPGGPS